MVWVRIYETGLESIATWGGLERPESFSSRKIKKAALGFWAEMKWEHRMAG